MWGKVTRTHGELARQMSAAVMNGTVGEQRVTRAALTFIARQFGNREGTVQAQPSTEEFRGYGAHHALPKLNMSAGIDRTSVEEDDRR
jgi:hypothetical protein